MEDVARRRRAVVAAIAAGLHAGLLFYLSSRSGGGTPLVPFRHGDKLLHGVAYAVLGGLVAIALSRGGRLGWLRGLAALAIAVLYGVSDEWHQSFVPGRDTSFGDLLADTIGAAVAILAVARHRAADEDRHANPP